MNIARSGKNLDSLERENRGGVVEATSTDENVGRSGKNLDSLEREDKGGVAEINEPKSADEMPIPDDGFRQSSRGSSHVADEPE